MASDSHRHGDKWIKHNLTVIDKDGAHPDGGWKSRTSRPGASDTRLRTSALRGVQASASASNSTARRSNSLRSFGIGALTAQLRR